MARDGLVRKVGPRDWLGFLRWALPATVWKAFWGQVGEGGDPRTRWSAKYLVLCWVVMGWSNQRRLVDRFAEARSWLGVVFRGRRRPGDSYAGLAKAAGRWGEETFQRFWTCVRSHLPGRLKEAWRWYGWVVMAVDGSRCEAPRTRANQRGLGCAGRAKTGPQWWMTWVVHLPSKVIWDWRQGPGTSSERTHLRQMLGGLPPGTMVVADAGFMGFDLISRVLRAGADVLVRCASGTRLPSPIGAWDIEQRGQGDVYLWPKHRRKRPPIHMRLIVLKRGGRRVYLLTNVLATQRLSRAMAGDLYAARWGVETNYRALKARGDQGGSVAERRRLAARTPQAGAVELAGNIVALALLLFQAAVLPAAKAGQVSVAAALRTIRRAMEAVRWGGGTGWFIAAMRGAVRDGYVRRRSKRARDWPHKKQDPPLRPPKLRRLTPREKARIHRLERDPVPVLG